jgi:hypothetical protein
MGRGIVRKLSLIVAGAVVAAAGAVVAEVPNGAWDTEDQKDPDAYAYLEATGDYNYSWMEVDCDGLSSVYAETNHPDRVKLKKDNASQEQTQKNNQGSAWIRADTGEGSNWNLLSCEKVEVSNEVNLKKDRGKFEASGKDCTCDPSYEGGNCALFEAQVEILATDCAGNKNVDGKGEGGTISKFKLKGKGTVTNAPE